MPESANLSQFDSPEASPGFSLWQVSNLWQKRINAGLSPLDLTHVQFVLLATLAWNSEAGQPLTQVELAALAKTDVMMTSNVLRTLEKKGLIQRRPHPMDARAKILSVTAAGRSLIGKAIAVVEAIDTEFFGALGQDVGVFNRQLLRLVGG